MLVIWGRNNSINVQKVLWCCEELGLAYRRIDAGGPFGRTAEPDYLAMNPTGKVPTIVDDGFSLWESNAIVRYLAQRHSEGAFWPTAAQTRARADQWMDWQATVWSDFRPAFIGLLRTPEDQQDHARIRSAIAATARHLALLDTHLAANRYVVGSDFSMGDVPLGATVNRWFRMAIERPPLPHLQAWYEQLLARPAYAAAVTAIPLS
jgi:glutathione S-transferase